ncbi:hypothetical protein H6G45_18090 [Synechocystis sp. FACHB-383]|uniref:hypothetical protein n=1 Tax=Synechocystis sp. FACHB-383 TaxID=2692864 RepID=UPI0016877757|nr:hypothetical protein [Synechocystis sp. FACHB-383]MBD2655359.1 hypothetical protein [Synechocystis sp. FACHB-383]
MKLFCQGIQEFDNPTDETVSECLFELPGIERFAILKIDEDHYIQCYFFDEESNEFLIEYRDGSEAKHFQLKEFLSLESTINAFIEYKNGCISWAKLGNWKKLEF